MCSDVSVEVRRMSECLVTVRALVGRGRAVGRLVLLKVGLLTESLVADCALEWSLSCREVFCYQELKLF